MRLICWNTATVQGEQPEIVCGQSGATIRPVYLLQPHGQAPIVEQWYKGYGVFGGVDAYEWLAQKNIPAETLANMSTEEIRSAGISIEDNTELYQDTNGQWYTNKWSWFAEDSFPSHRNRKIHVFDNYDDIICEEMDYNAAIEQGMLTLVPQNAILAEIGVKDFYPLKFSFDPEAQYDSLSPSERVPNYEEV